MISVFLLLFKQISQKFHHRRLVIYVWTHQDVVGHRQKTSQDSETHGLNVREVYVGSGHFCMLEGT